MPVRLGPPLQFLIALAILATSPLASAEWQVVRHTDEPSINAGLIHRHVEMAESDTGDRATLELAIFSTKDCAMRVVDNPDGAKDLEATMARGDFLAGVNGGYFDPAFAPLGLRVVDGKTTSRLTRGRLMSGVLVSGPGPIQLLRVAEFASRKKSNARAAIECGPFLVDQGKPVPGLEATRGARRTFAAVAPNDRAAIGYCSDATLSELGKILASLAQPDFKIQRALNFDGGSSTAFWFKRQSGSAFSISESKYVRDFVAIVPKSN